MGYKWCQSAVVLQHKTVWCMEIQGSMATVAFRHRLGSPQANYASWVYNETEVRPSEKDCNALMYV